MLHICVENHNQYNLASQGGLPRLRKSDWNFLLWACQDALSLSNKLHNEIDMWKMKWMIKDKKRKQWNKWQENKVLKWIVNLIETHLQLINDWKIRQALM
jgi:hypothetical protein